MKMHFLIQSHPFLSLVLKEEVKSDVICSMLCEEYLSCLYNNIFSCFYLQVWNLSKEQKSRSTQIQSDTQRRRSQIEKNLKRSIKKK